MGRSFVGFEIELSVPTLRRGLITDLAPWTAGGPQPDPLIGTFFAGGLDYKAEMGAITTSLGHTITLTSDHDAQMGATGRAFSDAIGAADPEATENAE